MYSIYKNKETKEYICYPDMFDLPILKRRSIRIKQKIMYNSGLAKKFITLTYNDKHLISDYKNDIHLFIKRLKYYLTTKRKNSIFSILPGLEYCWKFETNSIGQRDFNPHFHVILNLKSFLHEPRVRLMWGKGFVRLNQITGKRDLVKYVSKYMAKDSTIEFETNKIRDWTKCVSCVSNEFTENMKILGCPEPPAECLISRKRSFSSSRGYKKAKSDFRYIFNLEESEAYEYVIKKNKESGVGAIDDFK